MQPGDSPSIYEPLNSAGPEIRILMLLPSEVYGSLVECRLIHSPLLESPEYETLSYSWGEPEFTQRIMLNTQPFFVTRNLETALRYLRLPAKDRALWVDALCIDQNNHSERSHQVGLMKEIYANGTAGCAWLPASFRRRRRHPEGSHYQAPGEEEERQQEEEIFRKRCDMMGRGMQLLKNLHLKDAETLVRMETRMKETGGSPNGVWLLTRHERNLLTATFQSPHIWHRVWVMQELACSPRVILVAGRHSLEWTAVSGFLGDRPYADAFHALFGHGSGMGAIDGVFGAIQKIEHQRQIMRDIATKGYESKLLDILARFQAAKATDPRDYIYGLLGLVSKEHGIKVDYRKTAVEVFKDTTVSLINSQRNLDILCQTSWMTGTDYGGAKRTPDIENLPSWIPDFSRDIAYDEHSRILFAQRGIYAAGAASLQGPCEVLDDRLLHVRAIELGRINCPRGSGSEDHRRLKSHLSWVKTHLGAEIREDDIGLYAPTGEPSFRAYWRTLVMDCKAYPISRLSYEEVAVDDATFRDIWRFTLNLAGSTLDPGDSPGAYKEVKNDDDASLEALETKLSSRVMWLRNKNSWSFRLTDNGLYTMIRSAEEGDLIAVVEGAKVPLVLREGNLKAGCRTIFTLVGSAYVHGFMDGEAVKLANEGKLSQKDILLG